MQCNIFNFVHISLRDAIMQCYSTDLFQMLKHSIAKKKFEIILAVITTDSTRDLGVQLTRLAKSVNQGQDYCFLIFVEINWVFKTIIY